MAQLKDTTINRDLEVSGDIIHKCKAFTTSDFTVQLNSSRAEISIVDGLHFILIRKEINYGIKWY